MDKTILCISCPDQPGIVAQITSLIKDANGNILCAEQFTETEIEPRWFYIRLEIEQETIKLTQNALETQISKLAQQLSGNYKFVSPSPNNKKNVVILVTKTSHCLTELLWRQEQSELNMNLKGVISNSMTLKTQVENHKIPFQYIDIKDNGFLEISKICRKWDIHTIVMARFMRIAPEWFCKDYEGRILNIHHSFLPSFIGAKPYHQAKDRGVKIIGATCHYVTKDLDCGPIIEQEVVKIEHYHTIDKMITLGQDCEKLALSKALKLHLEDRVFIHGNKTIVFKH